MTGIMTRLQQHPNVPLMNMMRTYNPVAAGLINQIKRVMDAMR